MTKEYSFEEIERYLEGDMGREDKETFEKSLSEDNRLAKRVREQKDAHDMVELYTRDTIKHRIKSIHDKTKKQSKTGFSQFPAVRIAASITAVLLVAAAILYGLAINYDTQKLADNAFEPYPNRFRTMGENEQGAFYQGLTAYDQQDYSKAITQLSKVVTGNEKYLDAQFYLGVAFLGSKQYAEALPPFLLVIEENSLYESSAKWYLSLVYLHLDKEEDAKIVLKDIVDMGGAKSQIAKKLLDDLDSDFRKLPFVR